MTAGLVRGVVGSSHLANRRSSSKRPVSVPGVPQPGGSNSEGPDPTLAPVLLDVQGPYTVTVFGNGGRNVALCLASASTVSLERESTVVGQRASVAEASVAVDRVSFTVRDGQSYTLAEGRAGASVTGVTLTLDDATTVESTTGNGVFVAW